MQRVLGLVEDVRFSHRGHEEPQGDQGENSGDLNRHVFSCVEKQVAHDDRDVDDQNVVVDDSLEPH